MGSFDFRTTALIMGLFLAWGSAADASVGETPRSATAGRPYVGEELSRLALSFCIPPTIEPGVLAAMEEETRRMLGPSGIPVEPVPWELLADGREPGGYLIRVLLIDREPSRWGLQPDAMAAVRKWPGERFPRVAFVFLPVIRRVLAWPSSGLRTMTASPRLDDRQLGTALGRIVAHEIVHALSPRTSHRRGGAMAAGMSRDQLLATTARLDDTTLAELRDAWPRVMLAARDR